MDVTARLWFSRDDQWDPNDRLSPTIKQFTIATASSAQQRRTWSVPALSLAGVGGNEHYVIVRVEATAPRARR
jgi:hypothetical protein